MMNKAIKSTLMMLLITIPYSESHAGSSPILSTDIPVGARQLLIRQAAKDNQSIQVDDYIKYDDKRDDAFDQSTGECGNVNIGNIDQNQRIGTVPRTVNVIVTGPVFNTVDDC